MQSTISRFACRILVDRNEPHKARIFAAGFDSSRNIFLGVSCWLAFLKVRRLTLPRFNDFNLNLVANLFFKKREIFCCSLRCKQAELKGTKTLRCHPWRCEISRPYFSCSLRVKIFWHFYGLPFSGRVCRWRHSRELKISIILRNEGIQFFGKKFAGKKLSRFWVFQEIFVSKKLSEDIFELFSKFEVLKINQTIFQEAFFAN